MTVTAGDKQAKEVDVQGSFTAYLEYNKILRTWFVAFGAGGSALLLVNKELSTQLASLGELRYVAVMFLGGAAAQIVGALLNKYANWYVYSSADDHENGDHWKYKFAEWIIEQFWLDVVFDAITVASYGAAIWKMLTAFAS